MVTGFTFCIPIKSKKVEDVMKAYTDNICCVFEPSKKILTDNGTEFKNKLWTDVFKRICTEHRTSPIYSPQCNGKIEGFHKFLKATIGKQLQKGLEWDDVIPKATSACNFFLMQSSKEAPFFIAMDLIGEFHPLQVKETGNVWPTSSSKTYVIRFRITKIPR